MPVIHHLKWPQSVLVIRICLTGLRACCYTISLWRKLHINTYFFQTFLVSVHRERPLGRINLWAVLFITQDVARSIMCDLSRPNGGPWLTGLGTAQYTLLAHSIVHTSE